MKSVVVALIIGFGIVLGSLVYTEHLENISEQLLIYNNEVSELITAEKYSEASDKLNKLEAFIEERRTMMDSTGKHGNLDEIKKNLTDLKTYVQNNSQKEALVKSQSLEFLFGDLPRNFQLRIENIL